MGPLEVYEFDIGLMAMWLCAICVIIYFKKNYIDFMQKKNQ